jgi:CheY-like chemotaxis protein
MGSISILLADDSITIQKVVGIIFGSDDYSLTIVDNGKAAVQKAQELQPDVLLIDALMPGMSGYEVCEAIRKDAALAAKPVLLLTGSFEPFDEDKARQCGADDHIIKPFESQQIVAKVQELYQLGLNRSSGTTPVVSDVVEAPVIPQPVVAEETFEFEQTAQEIPAVEEDPSIEESTFAFQPEPELDSSALFVSQSVKPEPLRTPDDPWGAFTQQPVAAVVAPAADSEHVVSPFDAVQPDVMSLVTEEPAELPVERAHHDNIGASWVPVEEQTFEFREEYAVVPPEVAAETVMIEEPVKAEPAFTPDVFEPVAACAPEIEKVPEVPQQASVQVTTVLEPVSEVPSAALALTDEQLKSALLSASKETIERIVWEVVPDLAEAMIKEAIKRITEGK